MDVDKTSSEAPECVYQSDENPLPPVNSRTTGQRDGRVDVLAERLIGNQATRHGV